MRTRLIVGLVIVALAVTASVMINAAPRGRGAAAAPPPAVGAPGPGGPGCPLGWGMHFGKIAKELGLTEAQIKELKVLAEEFMAATKATREELQAKCKEMCGLWAADPPDAAAIKALAAWIDGLRAELRDAGIDQMIRALDVLTPAQREKVRAMLKKCIENCRGMGCGMLMGPGPGCGLGLGPGGPGPACCPRGMGGGMGPGWGNGTGPRAGTGACPLTK